MKRTRNQQNRQKIYRRTKLKVFKSKNKYSGDLNDPSDFCKIYYTKSRHSKQFGHFGHFVQIKNCDQFGHFAHFEHFEHIGHSGHCRINYTKILKILFAFQNHPT